MSGRGAHPFTPNEGAVRTKWRTRGEYPAFPFGAALVGFGAAVLVGALAGAIPAVVAARVKVIDAIRF
ncbi:hypothetical protein J3A64_002453 [Pseudarthrobacter sp. PvP004]|uniref:ABC transporter permease n=1 Tax=Pseudarthrobacter sp. PvP004 TaxID=2817850 RepID=UPI001AE3CCEA|nr:ABC transporter permease [Pseudarthrobacter sp. PvP004]MBP2266989.1 hypothetical protein [Pseudarthrobacter sp. PvP004]